MSYNIDHIETLVFEAWMDAKDIVELSKLELPESSMIEYALEAAEELLAKSNKCSKCKTKNEIDAGFCKKCGEKLTVSGSFKVTLDKSKFYWTGEGSGGSFEDIFLKKIAPKIHGHIEAIVFWEGGDAVGGFIIKDDEVTECDVEYKLVPSKKK